jgi:hypothetical protein
MYHYSMQQLPGHAASITLRVIRHAGKSRPVRKPGVM